MIVQCPECKDHYEDTSHGKKCPHNWQRPSALDDHLAATVRARADHAAREGVPLTHTPPVRPALAPLPDADASDDQLPTAP